MRLDAELLNANIVLLRILIPVYFGTAMLMLAD